MIHLTQHENGKFEVVTVANGNLIVSSNPQQYEKRSGCYTNIRSQMKNFPGATGAIFQDDTKAKPLVYLLPVKGSPILQTTKPKPPYVFGKK